jgi:phospholipase/carboxylesterase
MSTIANISGPEQPPAKGEAKQLVVFLHGWGADGNDLIGLAREWAGLMPGSQFVSPHAHEACEGNPMGRQWFSFRDETPEAITAKAAEAGAIINQFIDGELERHGLDDSQLGLVGFSQGAMMSVYVALRRAKPCAAVVGYSGAIIASETIEAEIRSRPPMLLAHGETDQVVPFTSLGASVQMLGQYDVPVRWHACPRLGHGIDGVGLEMGGEFLHDGFKDAAKP